MRKKTGQKQYLKHFSPWQILVSVFSITLAVWLYYSLAGEGFHYEWQWNRVWRHFGQWTAHGFKAGPLLKGLLLTLGIASIGLAFSIMLGLILALMRFSASHFYRLLALTHITIFRNTPLLLQLFFIYFLIAPLFALGPFWSAVITLAAFEGAYLAEIFRAGILAVPKQQWEASLSLGFSLAQTFFMIILPQAIRNVLPALTNQAVSLVKDTSLVSAIAVADLTLQAQAIIAETFLAFEVWLLVAAIYLLITLCISLPAIWLENNLKTGKTYATEEIG